MEIVGPLPRSRSGKRFILVVCDYTTHYPEAVPPVAPQASSGFSPFELLYGRTVRGPLDVRRETWGASTKSNENVVSYKLVMREKCAGIHVGTCIYISVHVHDEPLGCTQPCIRISHGPILKSPNVHVHVHQCACTCTMHA